MYVCNVASLSMEDFNIYIYIYLYRRWMVIVQLLFLFLLTPRVCVCLIKTKRVQEWEEKKIYTQYACSRVSPEGEREKKSRSVFANPRTDR
jgi:hypothetical protein